MIYHDILENARIRLRALEPSDIDLLYKWENNTDVWIISSTQTPFSREILNRYIEASEQDIYSAKQLRLMIEARDQANKAIGTIDLFDFDPNNRRAGVGVLIAPEERGKHYGSDALETIINYSYKVLNLHQLYANVLNTNEESVAMFEKCGFSVIGIKKEWVRSPEGWLDEYMLQRLTGTNNINI